MGSPLDWKIEKQYKATNDGDSREYYSGQWSAQENNIFNKILLRQTQSGLTSSLALCFWKPVFYIVRARSLREISESWRQEWRTLHLEAIRSREAIVTISPHNKSNANILHLIREQLSD